MMFWVNADEAALVETFPWMRLHLVSKDAHHATYRVPSVLRQDEPMGGEFTFLLGSTIFAYGEYVEETDACVDILGYTCYSYCPVNFWRFLTEQVVLCIVENAFCEELFKQVLEVQGELLVGTPIQAGVPSLEPWDTVKLYSWRGAYAAIFKRTTGAVALNNSRLHMLMSTMASKKDKVPVFELQKEV